MIRRYFFNTIFIIIILISFLACKQHPEYRLISPKFANDRAILDTSYIEIEIDSNRQLFDYKVSSSNDDGLYCGYNHKLKSLDIYNLSNGKAVSQNIIEDSGYSKIGHITGCHIVNLDSIFLISEKEILLVNNLGKIKKNIKINSLSEARFFKSNYIIEFERTKNFTYNNLKKTLYVTCMSARGMDLKKSYYNSPVAEIEINNKLQFQNTAVSWSNLYKKSFYGFLSTLFVSFKGENIITSFPVEPNIYVYNTKLQKTTIYGGYPDLGKMKSLIALPLDEDFRYDDDKKLAHYFENVIYGKVIPDAKNSLYYRVINLGLKNSEKGIQNFETRKRVLTVYNGDFEIIKKIDLNDQRYIEDGAFNTKQGLLFPCPHRANSLRFKLFKFKKQ